MAIEKGLYEAPEGLDEMEDMEDQDIEGSRIYYSTVELPAYKKIANIFETQKNMINELGPITKNIRINLLEGIKGVN